MMSTVPDSVLFIGFGGPTPGCCGRLDPCPGREALCFVQGIVGPRPGAQARIAEVAAHYDLFGGFSPFNPLTFQQADRVAQELREQGHAVPVHVGMRYWPPYVRDVLRDMVDQGSQHILAVILSPFQCEASWEQYQNVVTAGLEALGTQAPQLTYLSPWHTHTGYIAAIADTIGQAQQSLRTVQTRDAMLIYTAHSIPEPMAAQAPYVRQFTETAQVASQVLGHQEYRLAYQSQVTGTSVAWLQPDINDTITRLHAEGYHHIIISPIGFLCDHVEVLYDLDVQAHQTAADHGMTYTRASTVGNHPAFVHMLSTLIIQQLTKD